MVKTIITVKLLHGRKKLCYFSTVLVKLSINLVLFVKVKAFLVPIEQRKNFKINRFIPALKIYKTFIPRYQNETFTTAP